MRMAKRTALVTGASGLAGGYMLAHLLEQGGWDIVAGSGQRQPRRRIAIGIARERAVGGHDVCRVAAIAQDPAWRRRNRPGGAGAMRREIGALRRPGRPAFPKRAAGALRPEGALHRRRLSDRGRVVMLADDR